MTAGIVTIRIGTTITSPTSGQVLTSTSLTLTWSATGATWSSFHIFLDNQFVIWVGPDVRTYTLSGLSYGAHSVKIAAFDNVAGHPAIWSDPVSFTVSGTTTTMTSISGGGMRLPAAMILANATAAVGVALATVRARIRFSAILTRKCAVAPARVSSQT